jgi:hypothetical protein
MGFLTEGYRASGHSARRSAGRAFVALHHRLRFEMNDHRFGTHDAA